MTHQTSILDWHDEKITNWIKSYDDNHAIISQSDARALVDCFDKVLIGGIWPRCHVIKKDDIAKGWYPETWDFIAYPHNTMGWYRKLIRYDGTVLNQIEPLSYHDRYISPGHYAPQKYLNVESMAIEGDFLQIATEKGQYTASIEPDNIAIPDRYYRLPFNPSEDTEHFILKCLAGNIPRELMAPWVGGHCSRLSSYSVYYNDWNTGEVCYNDNTALMLECANRLGLSIEINQDVQPLTHPSFNLAPILETCKNCLRAPNKNGVCSKDDIERNGSMCFDWIWDRQKEPKKITRKTTKKPDFIDKGVLS